MLSTEVLNFVQFCSCSERVSPNYVVHFYQEWPLECLWYRRENVINKLHLMFSSFPLNMVHTVFLYVTEKYISHYKQILDSICKAEHMSHFY